MTLVRHVRPAGLHSFGATVHSRRTETGGMNIQPVTTELWFYMTTAHGEVEKEVTKEVIFARNVSVLFLHHRIGI